ncbi:PH domain-containing protein [Chryseomicrobium palamuruense]|uniref:PH domain-containing protein n=1 Tax=Chryseomicrobium palamuruense TaxID=682973 RepID=A0ABV8UUW4_9BACL
MQNAKHLSQKGLTVWRIYGLIQTLVLLLLAVGVGAFNYFFFETTWIYVVAVTILILLGVAIIGIIPNVRWKRWRYEVREHEIEYQHGLFVIKRTIIPMVRVQHVDSEQGPILRNYHLASIHISTAATQHTIPFLNEQEAEAMRMRISELARVAEDDV